jgi:hypothetical protein
MPIVDYESSKTYTFSVFDSSGSPKTGLSGTWLTLEGTDSGVAVSSPATAAPIVEISNGLYKTTIDWVSLVASEGLYDGEDVVGIIDWGVTLTAPERYTYTGFNTRDFAPFKDSELLALSQADIELVKELQTGKWEIDGTQLLLYKSDNTTLIATFDLFNKDGLASGEAPYSRVRV